MNSKEALRKLYFDNEDLKVDITLNDNKVCEIHNIIRDDLDKLDDLKKVVKILQEKLDIKIEFNHNAGYSLNHKVIHNCITSNERCIRHLEVEEGNLLKEYLDE